MRSHAIRSLPLLALACTGCMDGPIAEIDTGIDADDRDAGGLVDAARTRDAGPAFFDAFVPPPDAGPRLFDTNIGDASGACAAPRHLYTIGAGNFPISIAEAAGYLYVVSPSEGVNVVDARDPSAMNAVAGTISISQPAGVAARDGTMVVTGQATVPSYQVYVFDTTTPATPHMLYVLDDGTFSTRVLMMGSLVLDVGYAGLATWALGATSGREVGSVTAAGGPELSVDRDGDRVAVASAHGQVFVIDVSAPAAPRIEAMGSTGTQTYSVALAGNRVYVGGDDGITMMTVSGTTIDVDATVRFVSAIWAMARWRDALVVVTQYGGTYIVDPNDPMIHRAEVDASGWAIAIDDADVAFIVDGPNASVTSVDLCP